MRHTESEVQRGCVTWFRLQYRELGALLVSVPNGAYSPQGKILKAEGMVSGAADLLLFVPAGDYHGLCIEMKTESGRQSLPQMTWQCLVEAQGYRYVICRSFDEFRNEINNYLSHNENYRDKAL